MAYLPDYGHDLFVSYVHEEQLGEWTTRLREELRKALNLILYLKPPDNSIDVWIDEVLRKNLPLTDELKERVEGSALLLVVMSPFYLRSAWCGKEVDWFTTASRSRIAPDRRVFVVHALPTERKTWPTYLAELPGYSFFALHPNANVELPLGLIGDKDDEVAFKQALYNLAGQIKLQLDELIKEATAPLPLLPTVVRLPRPVSREPLAAPTRLVCLDVLGTVPASGPSAFEREVRRILTACNVEVFSPGSLGVAPHDPIGADRYLQRLLKAKAGCDGLIALRTDQTAPIADWLLDYFSEVRPAARRVRIGSSVPIPLVVDAAPTGAGSIPDEVRALSYSDSDFEARLTAWINDLPFEQREAA